LVRLLEGVDDDYRFHPEAKALAQDGKPCHRWTSGLLKPPRVRATRIARVGKETNPLADSADLIPEDDERAASTANFVVWRATTS
jgi:hypothetical protein